MHRVATASPDRQKKVLIASERERPDVAERRKELRREQPHLNPERLVFIDETWAKTNMTRPRGRALRGQRLLASVPHGHWKTTTFLAALRTTGLTAPLVVDGAINGELFLGWVIHHLVPTLQPGDIVVMDNLGAHKVAGVREAITAAEARLVYLPPYSPDLNPIELVFSKFKWLLKSASARTVETLWSVCSDVLDRFTEQECRNCFRHCGYRYT
jgi:transposase